MFSDLFKLGSGKPSADAEHSFVQDVQAKESFGRSRTVERLILAGWVLIVLKCFLVAWAVDRWDVPIGASWVIVPTLFMAAVCTALYYWRD